MSDTKKRRPKWRKRGRPSVPKIQQDQGTPELQRKRSEHATIEAIDLCLNRAIITPEMHRNALHFRWLYTLRFGVPSVQALNPTDFLGREQKDRSPDWLEQREGEYRYFAQKLKSARAFDTVVDVVVFNRPPLWNEIAPLRDGLELIC